MEHLDPKFVTWVQSELGSRGLKSSVHVLGPYESVNTLIQQYMIAGVHAISQLNLQSQSKSLISLQVFKRQPGSDEIRFEEYQDLEPKIAGDVIANAKAQSTQQYAQPQNQPPYIANQQLPPQHPYQPPSAPAPQIADLANAIGQMDNASLQQLLALSAPQTQAPQSANNHAPVDLASILGKLLGQQAAPPQAPPQHNYQAVQPPTPSQSIIPTQQPTLLTTILQNGRQQEEAPRGLHNRLLRLHLHVSRFPHLPRQRYHNRSLPHTIRLLP